MDRGVEGKRGCVGRDDYGFLCNNEEDVKELGRNVYIWSVEKVKGV